MFIISAGFPKVCCTIIAFISSFNLDFKSEMEIFKVFLSISTYTGSNQACKTAFTTETQVYEETITFDHFCKFDHFNQWYNALLPL